MFCELSRTFFFFWGGGGDRRMEGGWNTGCSELPVSRTFTPSPPPPSFVVPGSVLSCRLFYNVKFSTTSLKFPTPWQSRFFALCSPTSRRISTPSFSHGLMSPCSQGFLLTVIWVLIVTRSLACGVENTAGSGSLRDLKFFQD